jgi:hypothetical protein
VIVVVASIKGAPGVTTTAMALASSWPAHRRVLLVEADPFGGDLAAWFGVAPSTGLWSLLAAGRRGLDPDLVWDHATTLGNGVPVLYGLASGDQAVANEGAWPAVAQALADFDADAVIDAGRLLPHYGGGIGPLLSVAQVQMVLFPPTLPGIVHLKTALPSLRASSSGALMVVPTAHKGFSSQEIGATLKIDVAAPLPHDPKGAASLTTSGTGTTSTLKTALAKWARTTASELAASHPTTIGRHASTSTPPMQPPPLAPAGDGAVAEVGHRETGAPRADLSLHHADPSVLAATDEPGTPVDGPRDDDRGDNDAVSAVAPKSVAR